MKQLFKKISFIVAVYIYICYLYIYVIYNLANTVQFKVSMQSITEHIFRFCVDLLM